MESILNLENAFQAQLNTIVNNLIGQFSLKLGSTQIKIPLKRLSFKDTEPRRLMPGSRRNKRSEWA